MNRKRTEEELQQAQSLIAAAIDQSPSGILIASAPEVTIRFANRAAFRIRGETPVSLVGIELSEHYAAQAVKRLTLGDAAMRRLAEAKRTGPEQGVLL